MAGAGRGRGFLPCCSHLWSLLQSHVVLQKGPARCGGAMPKRGPATASPLAVSPQELVLPRRLRPCVGHSVPTGTAHCNPVVCPAFCCLAFPPSAKGECWTRWAASSLLPAACIPLGSQGYVRGSSKRGAQPALAEVADRDHQSGICRSQVSAASARPPSPLAGGCASASLGKSTSSSVSLGAAAFIRGMVAMLLLVGPLGLFWRHRSAVRVPRYHVIRVLDGTGLPAPSLPPGEQDPLLTLLQETWGWWPTFSSHQAAPGNYSN